MRPRYLPLLLTLLALGIAVASDFAKVLPAGVPDEATLATWEKIEGEVETKSESVFYEFYVNPIRQGLYEVTRYRMVRISKATDGTPSWTSETEKLLWNSRPGTSEPLRLFEHVGEEWRRMDPGSPRYQAEMRTAIHVYGLHRQALEQRQP